jgi:hypothetical protein
VAQTQADLGIFPTGPAVVEVAIWSSNQVDCCEKSTTWSTELGADLGKGALETVSLPR